ncbi:MAG: hypothetical protein J2P57_08790 [Acidimicrobiaceae bacterium]|nr:hypothetical protein [Acidimicrobiaceae bacterium]
MNWQTLQAAMPGLSASLAQQYQPLNDAAMVEFGISNLNRAQHWLAQTGHESVSLRYFEELASGDAYNNRPDLGNIYPGDGPRFKGRGPIQITGRHNYSQAAAALNLPLVENPAMAAEPQYGFRLSAWWWWNAGCNQIADGGPAAVQPLTLRINGGYNGLADRQNRYIGIQPLGDAVLPTPTTPPLTTSRRPDMLLVPGNTGVQFAIPPNTRVWLTAAGADVPVNWNIGRDGNVLHGDGDGHLTWRGWEIPGDWLTDNHTLYVEAKSSTPVLVTMAPR